MTKQGDRFFMPGGIRYYDPRSQREMLYVAEAGHEAMGWICYQHPDGQWVALKKADGRDLLAVQEARRKLRMELPRTPEEILARMEAVAERDVPHGYERSRLLEALPYIQAVQYLVDGAPHTAETWEVTRTKTRESVIGQIREYLPYAWDRANLTRGSSAIRSMAYFRGLIWLLGPEHDELVEWIGAPENFEFYGKPALVRISDVAGFDWHVRLNENDDPLPGRDNDDWRSLPVIEEGEVIDEGGTSYTADEVLQE